MSNTQTLPETLLFSENRIGVSEISLARGEKWKIPQNSGVARTLVVIKGYGLFVSEDSRYDSEMKPGHIIDMSRWAVDRGWYVEATGIEGVSLAMSSVRYVAH